MAIDWEAASVEAERQEREQRENAKRLEQQRHAAYLADRERIEREQPEAIKIALRLLEIAPEDVHEEIKAAAEVADLKALRSWEHGHTRKWRLEALLKSARQQS